MGLVSCEENRPAIFEVDDPIIFPSIFPHVKKKKVFTYKADRKPIADVNGPDYNCIGRGVLKRTIKNAIM